MKIKLDKKIIENLDINDLREYGINESEIDWESGLTIDLVPLTLKQLKKLQKLLEVFPFITVKAKKPLRDLQSWINICEDKTEKIKKLEPFEAALIRYIAKSLHHRIFVKHIQYRKSFCFVVTNIQYSPGTGYSPPSVDMTCICDKFGKRQEASYSFEYRDVLNKTIPQILAEKEIYLETPELRNDYLDTVERFKPIIPKVGTQYLLTGYSTDETPEVHHTYRSGHDRFHSDHSKVVIDVLMESDVEKDSVYDEDEKIKTGLTFWKNQYKKFKVSEMPLPSDDKSLSLEIPIHPVLVIFDLQRHMRLTTHIDYLTLYEYDNSLAEKLVLPSEIKNLVNILIEHKKGGFVDIIHGKSGGVIVLLAGPAGVGKTLTAEVFAESKEKPLYTIQAAQLGVKPDELESELRLCLKRTIRWDAILLIDEADVYIHKRENNINQNAIVGAFLRVLEYHQSFLFMTTNRSNIVDDAIVSRCLAKIDYAYPEPKDQKKIWRVLSDSSKINLDDSEIDKIIEKYNNLSGRDIKNLLKLANLKALSNKEKLTISIIDSIAQFNPVSKQDVSK